MTVSLAATKSTADAKIRAATFCFYFVETPSALANAKNALLVTQIKWGGASGSGTRASVTINPQVIDCAMKNADCYIVIGYICSSFTFALTRVCHFVFSFFFVFFSSPNFRSALRADVASRVTPGVTSDVKRT